MHTVTPSETHASATANATARAPWIDEVASRLDLSQEAAAGFASGARFTRWSGLSIFLTFECRDDRVTAARPTVLLGLHAEELAGEEVRVLLSLQASLLEAGDWFLGMADDGELQLTCRRPMAGKQLVAAVEMAELSAWSAVHTLLTAMTTWRQSGHEMAR
jgi:hypothetical protein